MTEDNVMEFCQWLVSEKGIEAGNLSDYINNNEEEVLKLAEEFKKPKFKIGGKIEAAVKKLALGDVLVKKTKTPIYTVVDSDGRIVEIEDPYDSEKKTIKLKLSQGDDGGTGRLVLGSDGLRDTRAYQKIFDLIEEDFKNKLQSNTAVEEQKDRISQLERELLLKDFESTNQKMAGFKVPVIKTPTLKSMTSGIGIKQSGGSISRREFKNLKESRKDVRSQAKELFGFNNGQFSTAYSGLKNAFLNNGLSRREAKLAAQRSLMNRTATPIVEDAPTNPHYSYQAPTKSYSYTDFNEMELEPMNITPMGYDTMSFNDAFASARRAGGNTGNNTFRWRGKLYGTKLAGEVNGNTNKTVDLKNNYDLNIDEEPMYITPMGYDAMSLNSAFARAWEQRSKTGKKYLKYNGEVYDLDEIENIDLGVDFKDLEEGYNH